MAAVLEGGVGSSGGEQERMDVARWIREAKDRAKDAVGTGGGGACEMPGSSQPVHPSGHK